MLALRSPLAFLAVAALFGPIAAQGVNVDWTPSTKEVILNTESTRILTSIGWVTVKGGVFVFRNVTIPAGTVVRGDGRNPLVFVIAGRFVLDGELTVRGGDGLSVTQARTANIPTASGRAVCGGGNGGRGSPQTFDRSYFGESGYGPLGFPGFGGKGGRMNCANGSCAMGSGGGGGSFATAGDPYYKLKSTTHFVQPRGVGGYGCLSRTTTALPGGVAGPVYFVDNNPGNNFVGLGYDVNRRRFVPGELPFLLGGSGGAGGGDSANSCASQDPSFHNDERGGGGGAGGGAVVILAQGEISIGLTGRIDASGGNGGAGRATTVRIGGGGGGGAGGFVALYSRTRLVISVRGETYANNDFDFPISADGGVGRIGKIPRGPIDTKYPPKTVAHMDAVASGGMGGLGIIQFMVPPGKTNADGTNTVLDDNIILRGVGMSGAKKQRYLAWRGFPNAAGKWVDDKGNETKIGDKAGDFRPTPILLPVF